MVTAAEIENALRPFKDKQHYLLFGPDLPVIADIQPDGVLRLKAEDGRGPIGMTTHYRVVFIEPGLTDLGCVNLTDYGIEHEVSDNELGTKTLYIPIN